MAQIDVAAIEGPERSFSVCTLVNDWKQYEEMTESFLVHGFDREDCEFIYIDNMTENRLDGFSGINRFLSLRRAVYLVLCHQDVRLVDDGRAELEAIIDEMNTRDPAWAVLGNAGGIAPGKLAIRISDPHGERQHRGELPVRTCGLDENFLVVRTDANLGLSCDLSGFHLYAADLCLHAQLLGRTCYVVNFHLRHLSPGKGDASFFRGVDAFVSKYRRAFAPRWVTTPSAVMFLTANSLVGALLNSRLGVATAKRAGSLLAARRP
jgi:hypothetical protein